MKSIAQMLDRLEGLRDTRDLTEWQNNFLRSVLDQHAAGRSLSDKQAETVEQLYERHFA